MQDFYKAVTKEPTYYIYDEIRELKKSLMHVRKQPQWDVVVRQARRNLETRLLFLNTAVETPGIGSFAEWALRYEIAYTPIDRKAYSEIFTANVLASFAKRQPEIKIYKDASGRWLCDPPSDPDATLIQEESSKAVEQQVDLNLFDNARVSAYVYCDGCYEGAELRIPLKSLKSRNILRALLSRIPTDWTTGSNDGVVDAVFCKLCSLKAPLQ